MYTKSSEFYDSLYKFKNFERETEVLIKIILSANPKAISILDVACGTNEHVRFLKDTFEVDGIDLNPVFLNIARKKNVTGEYTEADMRSFNLHKKYDVVICLSSSIGYLSSTKDLNTTLKQFTNHLNPNGLVLIEPWYSLETWNSDIVAMTIGEQGGVKVARASIRSNVGAKSLLTFHYMVARPDRIETFKEDHHLMLFSRQQMSDAFSAAGLQVRHDETWSKGRGLYIGTSKK